MQNGHDPVELCSRLTSRLTRGLTRGCFKKVSWKEGKGVVGEDAPKEWMENSYTERVAAVASVTRP